MNSIHDQIRRHIFDYLGVDLPARLQRVGEKLTLEEIVELQTDWEFLEKMVRRLVMGWFRYGDNRDPSLPRHDHIARIRKSIEEYLRTGNLEYLIEIANFALLEFMKAPIGRGTMPAERLYWHAIDDLYGDPNLHTRELDKEHG